MVPYDAVMRTSRVDDVKLPKGLVKDVLDGKPNREIRAKIDEAKGKKAPIPLAKTPKDQSYRIDLPSATVTVTFKKGPVSKSTVKAMLLQALEEKEAFDE